MSWVMFHLLDIKILFTKFIKIQIKSIPYSKALLRPIDKMISLQNQFKRHMFCKKKVHSIAKTKRGRILSSIAMMTFQVFN